MQSFQTSQEAPAFLESPEIEPEAVPVHPSFIKSAAFLLVSFVIAYNLANGLHELGHLLANAMVGGITSHITLNPFWFSYTYFQTNPQPVIALWGGALFASLVAVAVWALMGNVHSPFLFPLRLVSMLGLATNGLYLLLDQASGLGGDGSMLVVNGMPRAVVEGGGLALLLLGLLVGLELAPEVGIRPQDSLGRRLLILAGGILPYLAFTAAYISAFHPETRSAWLILLMAGAAAVLVYTVIGWLAPQGAKSPQPAVFQLHWWQIEILLAVGLAIVAAELWFFPL